jgi:ATP-binding protein involved in chromosome partitioning
MSKQIDESQVYEMLESVEDPALQTDIVSAGLVDDVTVTDDEVAVSLVLGAPYSPDETDIGERVRTVLSEAGLEPHIDPVSNPPLTPDIDIVDGVTNVIAVASGKGGVGKSTVATNIAAALADSGARVGLFDSDVYGPNVPEMLDADEPVHVTDDDQYEPPEKFGMKLMSVAFLSGDTDPVIWRGAMVNKVLLQLWEKVAWGELDYMVVDLPPGTGDAQLTMLQSVPVTGALIVTTPQSVAVGDARRQLEMFEEHDTEILGVVENMSTFVCSECETEHDIFDTGGGKEIAAQAGVQFLGAVPLDPQIRAQSDAGVPVVRDGDSPATGSFQSITESVTNRLGYLHRAAAQE